MITESFVVIGRMCTRRVLGLMLSQQVMSLLLLTVSSPQL